MRPVSLTARLSPILKEIKHLFFCLLAAITFLFGVNTDLFAYQAILEITLNSEPKGSFFVEATDEGNFLINKGDFPELGLPIPETEPVIIDDAEYFPLSGDPSLTFGLNEATLTLEIEVKPDILPLNRIDFTNRRPENIYRPEENSFFVNYGLSTTGTKDDATQSIDFIHELALRNEQTLFLSDGIYSKTRDDSGYVRLLSRIIREDREKLQRITVGDHYVLSGPLGGQVLIGGGGYARQFMIDPYYINYPAVQMGGVTATPSTAEIYIDGMLQRKEELPPGPFELENITRYEGAGNVEVVIRDAFGREQRLTHPFYLAESLLVPGEHEFSYNAGFLREDIGIESNTYTDAVFSGFYRHGWRDWLTVGVSSEVDSNFFSLAPRVSLKWEHYGFFDISIGGSSGSQNNGFATALEYSYRNRRFSSDFKFRNFSENFARLGDELRMEKPEMAAQVNFGYSIPSLGSLNLGVTSTTFHDGEDRDEFALTYNKRLSRKLSMYVTVNQLSAQEDETILLLGFNYSPWRQNQINARFEERERSRTASIGIQKNPPVGEGYGYQTDLNFSDTIAGDIYSVSAAGQYNNRYSILRADTELASVDGDFTPVWRLSASGAIAFIGGGTHFSRPIRDSFVLVKVGDLKDVRVVRNSSVIGTTDEKGLVVVPELTSYYDNQVAVRDEDIPIEYGIETALHYVQPPLRSGSCITFSATRIQPIIGKFFILSGGKRIPYDFRPLKIEVNDAVIETQTGFDGEFYIDVTEAGGGHAIQLGCDNLRQVADETAESVIVIDYNYDGEAGQFKLAIPASDEIFIELGDVILNDTSIRESRGN